MPNPHCSSLSAGRNPDGDNRPWCIADLPSATWRMYCDVPFCDGEIKVNNLLCGTLKDRQQADYRGTINVTYTGKTCQRWGSQVPHQHPNTPEHVPFAGLDANYCRNPDSEAAAWCYTDDENTRWEYCNVPFCEVLYFSNDTSLVVHVGKGSEIPVEDDQEACGRMSVLQADYRGFINITETGRTCQRWDTQEPHEHTVTPENYYNDGLVDNYCKSSLCALG